MYVFSSLEAALNAGFRWSAYLADEQLHLVEVDRVDRAGRRVRALALARRDDAEGTVEP